MNRLDVAVEVFDFVDLIDFEGVSSVVDGRVGGDDWNIMVDVLGVEIIERTDLRAKNADAIVENEA